MENKRTISGSIIFKIIDTHGLPLCVVCDRLRESNVVFTVYDFVAAAIKNGWKIPTIISRLKESENFDCMCIPLGEIQDTIDLVLKDKGLLLWP